MLGRPKTSVIRKILSTELVGAGLLGFWILENDRWLWASAKSHAYGLVGFVIVDLALAFAVARGIPWDSMGVSGAALIQVLAMLGDLEHGQPSGVSSTAFRGYLLGDGSFLALLAIQSAILFTGLEIGLVRFLHQHPRWVTILHRK